MTRRVSSAGASRLPEMFVPPPNRNQHGIGLDAGLQHGLHRRLVAWTDDRVGEPADVAVAMADEVAQALPARVDDAVERIRRDPLAPTASSKAMRSSRGSDGSGTLRRSKPTRRDAGRSTSMARWR